MMAHGDSFIPRKASGIPRHSFSQGGFYGISYGTSYGMSQAIDSLHDFVWDVPSNPMRFPTGTMRQPSMNIPRYMSIYRVIPYGVGLPIENPSQLQFLTVSPAPLKGQRCKETVNRQAVSHSRVPVKAFPFSGVHTDCPLSSLERRFIISVETIFFFSVTLASGCCVLCQHSSSSSSSAAVADTDSL